MLKLSPRHVASNPAHRHAPGTAYRGSSHGLERIAASDQPALPIIALDGAVWGGIQPTVIDPYVDTAKYLKKTLTPPAERRWMRRRCKRLDIRKHGDWIVPRNGRPYQLNIYPHRERIEIQQPKPALLEHFSQRNDVHLSAIHLAVDLTFEDEWGKERALEIFQRHLVQRYQRAKRPNIHFATGISSNSKRKGGHFFTGYNSKPCRIDNNPHCFHFEDRRRGSRSMQAIGIRDHRDPPQFDHLAYWLEFERNGNLLDIDLERLGQHHENRRNKTKQRISARPFLGRRSKELYIGALLFRAFSRSGDGEITVDAFLRNYRRGPFIRQLPFLSVWGDRLNIFQDAYVDTETQQVAALGAPDGQRSRHRLR